MTDNDGIGTAHQAGREGHLRRDSTSHPYARIPTTTSDGGPDADGRLDRESASPEMTPRPQHGQLGEGTGGASKKGGDGEDNKHVSHA